MSTRPVILAVDDHPPALARLRDALIRRYDQDYRVIAHVSARAALDELEGITRTDEPVALVIADQWMPEMTGLEMLVRVHALAPSAQRAMLVGWGDRDATEMVLEGCAFDMLENYILKPWSPPEIHLYPVVGEFLSDWWRRHKGRMELVRVVCSELSTRGHEIRELLERAGVPYGFYIVESDEGRRMLAETGISGEVPAVIIGHGRVLTDPGNIQILEQLGVVEPEDRTCDLAVVGAGPAGLAAAVYGASEGLRTYVIDREVMGGQAGTSSLIRNYLGFPRGISGADLAQRAYQQAWLFGAKYILMREVTELRRDGARCIVSLRDGRPIIASAVVIATGASYRHLGVPRLERFAGAGLFYTAGPDVSFVMRGRDAIVVGGGNSAGQAVVHLAKVARHVLHLVRGHDLSSGMSSYLVQQIRRLPNVEVWFNSELVDGTGERSLERVTIENRTTGASKVLEGRVVFAMLGAIPHTDWLDGAVARDPSGYILTGHDVPDGSALPYETSLRGVFAAGDARSGSSKRLAAAIGEGGAAISSVHRYLKRAA